MQLDKDSDKGGHVAPKTDCPHIAQQLTIPLTITAAVEAFNKGCSSCEDKSENWMCLVCHKIFCSRYVQGHMVAHNKATGHDIATSLADLNTWCYNCDSYVISAAVHSAYQALHLGKFGNLPDSNLAITTSKGSKWSQEEKEDSDEETIKKVKQLADYIRSSKHLVFFTGAGISTSAKIADFRGPQGVWTLKAKGMRAESIKLEQATPTPCHMGILAIKEYIEKKGGKFYVVSQNIDGLHRRSGLKASEISELHGNSFVEICWKCGKDYLKTFDTANGSGVGGRNCAECLSRVPKFCHCTERKCECGAVLKDSIIHFGENLPQEALKKAFEHGREADLCVVLGSSLTVSPANDIPNETHKKGGKLVIVNLQNTYLDSVSNLRLYAKTDKVFELLMKELGITVPEFDVSEFLVEK